VRKEGNYIGVGEKCFNSDLVFLIVVFLMEKPRPSDEEIRTYLEEGYRFHKKNVKKYCYIVIRKGQKMHSLGPYADEFWNRILQLEYEFSEELGNSLKGGLILDDDEDARGRIRSGRRIQSLDDDFKEHLEIHRGTYKMTSCRYKKGLFCEYWVWKVGNSLYRIQEQLSIILKEPIEEYVRIFVGEDGTEKFVFRTRIPYCANCSVYVEKKS